MRAAILMAGLCLGLCLTASPAGAHRVNIFAFVDGDAVAVECGYNRSQKVRQGTVEVFDAESGEKLLQGLTDDKGVFRFPLSDAMLRAGHALRLRIIAGEGHQNEWIVEADELAAAGEARPSPGASPVAEPSAPASASASPGGSVSLPASSAVSGGASGGATPEDVERIVNAALDAKLSPIKRLLGEQVEAGPSLRDIIGGIGWIFGLIGVAAYFRRRP